MPRVELDKVRLDYSPLTKRIQVGSTDAKGENFLQKKDITGDFCRCVYAMFGDNDRIITVSNGKKFEVLIKEWKPKKSNQIAFIDPDPEDKNAIYYKDGTMVCSGDMATITDDGWDYAPIEIIFEKGVWLDKKAIECIDYDGYPSLSNIDQIIWDGNRMTNVAKVEEK